MLKENSNITVAPYSGSCANKVQPVLMDMGSPVDPVNLLGFPLKTNVVRQKRQSLPCSLLLVKPPGLFAPTSHGAG